MAQLTDPIWVYRKEVAPFNGSIPRTVEVDGQGCSVFLDVLVLGASPSTWSVLITSVDPQGQEVWSDTLLDHLGMPHADLVIDENNRVYACAMGPDSIRVRKYEPNGAVLWTTDIPHTGLQDLPLFIDEGEGYVFVATTCMGDSLGREFLVHGLTDAGVPIWEIRVPWSAFLSNQFMGGLCVDSSGRPYVTGYSFDTLAGSWVTIALDTDGSVRWEARAFPSIVAYGTDILPTEDGRIVVLGMKAAQLIGETDLAVLVYDTTGTMMWNQQVSIGGVDVSMGLSIGPDGSVYCIGTGTAPDGSKDLGAFSFDPTGLPTWSYILDDGPLDVLGSGIVGEAGGSCVLVGTRADPLQGGRSVVFTQRLDAAGQPLWSDLYAVPNTWMNGANDVVLDPVGDILVHGVMRDTVVSSEILLLKYARNTGMIGPGSATNAFLVWPNPATDRVRIACAGFDGSSSLRLIDALGRVVAWGAPGMRHLDLGAQAPGLYTVAAVNAQGSLLMHSPLVVVDR